MEKEFCCGRKATEKCNSTKTEIDSRHLIKIALINFTGYIYIFVDSRLFTTQENKNISFGFISNASKKVQIFVLSLSLLFRLVASPSEIQ